MIKSSYVIQDTEAVVQRCSVKTVILKILQNSQENTCVRVSLLIKLHVFSYEFCEIFKNTFFYRTPPVAASKNRSIKALLFWVIANRWKYLSMMRFSLVK